MNNSSVEAKYVDPDPTSALLIGVWLTIVGVFGIPLNIFIIIATVKVQEIRVIPSNAFIGSLALSDALFMLCLSLHLPYALTNNETLCKAIGLGVGTFGVLGTCIPPFLALNRYAVVCHQQERLARYMLGAFSRKGIYRMIFLLWTLEIVYQIPFVMLDTLGMHSTGMCSMTKKSANDLFVRVYYHCGILGVVAVSYIPLFIFYRKVSSWVKAMSAQLSLSRAAKETIRETESVLLLTKWVTLIPFTVTSPAFLIVILFEFNSEIFSVGVARLLISIYPLIPLLNAIITLKFARPYRLALQKVCKRTAFTSILFSWLIEGRWHDGVGVASDNTTSLFVVRT